MGKNSNALLGILTGAAIGTALGILFAPDKGSTTRKKIIDEANELKDKLQDNLENLKNDVNQKLSGKKENLQSEIDSFLSDASYKTEDVISALEKKLADLKEKNAKFQK